MIQQGQHKVYKGFQYKVAYVDMVDAVSHSEPLVSPPPSPPPPPPPWYSWCQSLSVCELFVLDDSTEQKQILALVSDGGNRGGGRGGVFRGGGGVQGGGVMLVVVSGLEQW